MKMKQRLLKYRAWDKKEKKMGIVISIEFSAEVQGHNLFDYSEENRMLMATQPDRGIEFSFVATALHNKGEFRITEPKYLFEFTGRKDKDDKEIYRGDLLKHNLWGVDEVIWDNEGACFRCKNKKHDITLAHHQLQRSRVIGNIYENKNLLK